MNRIERITKFVEESISDIGNVDEMSFGNIPNFKAQEIAFITGYTVRGSTKVLSAYAIRHIMSGHSNHIQEAKRGQIGVTKADFGLIPDILETPDSIEKANENNNGRYKGIVFMKSIGNKKYYVIANIISNKQETKLSVGTLFIKLT